MLEKFRGEHVVELVDYELSQSGDSKEALLLLEYCPKGHLLERLNMRNGSMLPIQEICRVFDGVLQAVHKMHIVDPYVVHRDLKLENILFTDVRSLELVALLFILFVLHGYRAEYQSCATSGPVSWAACHFARQRRGQPKKNVWSRRPRRCTALLKWWICI